MNSHMLGASSASNSFFKGVYEIKSGMYRMQGIFQVLRKVWEFRHV